MALNNAANIQGTTQFTLQVGNAVNSISSLAIGSSGQLIQSAGAGSNPAWTTATYPATAVQGDIVYGSATNVISMLAKDTNATRYLSNTGTSNSPAWAQIGLTTGVTGILPIANGGTNASSFTNTDGVIYFDGTSLNSTAVGTAGQVLTSNGAGVAPTFQAGGGGGITSVVTDSGTVTPSAGAITITGGGGTATILTSASGSTLTILLPTSAHGVAIGNAAGDGLDFVGAGATATFLCGNGISANPTFKANGVAIGTTGVTSLNANGILFGGTTITGPIQSMATIGSAFQVLTSNGSGLPSWSNPGIIYTVVTGSSAAMVQNSGWIANNAGTVSLSLPTSAGVGTMLWVTGINNATGWKITQAAGQQIFSGASQTTLGATGSITSAATHNSIVLVCVALSTTWVAMSVVGSPTFA